MPAAQYLCRMATAGVSTSPLAALSASAEVQGTLVPYLGLQTDAVRRALLGLKARGEWN